MEKMKMVDALLKMIEVAKEDKGLLKAFKNLAIRGQKYEMAAEFRDIENKNFPESEERRQAKLDASDLHMAFKMVQLQIPEDTCWLIANTLKKYNKKKGSFSLKDGAELQTKCKEYFED